MAGVISLHAWCLFNPRCLQSSKSGNSHNELHITTHYGLILGSKASSVTDRCVKTYYFLIFINVLKDPWRHASHIEKGGTIIETYIGKR